MDKQQYELLTQIKQRYLKTNGSAPFQIMEFGASASARQFYLSDLADNLVRPMASQHVAEYSQGSGSELDDKMKALRSSSALTFNMLGNDTCTIAHPDELFPSTTYSIQYEFQTPTLKSGMPANLDALLRGSSGDVVACEMKMLEWLTSTPAGLKDKYLDERNYLHPDTASAFIEVARALNDGDAFASYDFAQMFKHALALYNACRSDKLDAKKLTLLNCVWEPPANYELSDKTAAWLAKSTANEHAGFREFAQMMQPVRDAFERDCGVQFEIRYLPASELIGRLTYPADERTKLERYL